jgi:hypothetical protein
MVERKVDKPEAFLNILTEDMSLFFVSAFLLEDTSTELEGVICQQPYFYLKCWILTVVYNELPADRKNNLEMIKIDALCTFLLQVYLLDI